jgi:hypothetical protein
MTASRTVTPRVPLVAETAVSQTDVRCPICGELALERREGTRPVCDPLTGRHFEWSQKIVAFRHPDGEHAIPIGCEFPPEGSAMVDRHRETVNRPAHYDIGNGLQIIDVIERLGLNFNLGNALKYIVRAGRKSPKPLEDLRKATWYLGREIGQEEPGPATGPAMERVWLDVVAERRRQERLKHDGKFTYTCADAGMSDGARLAVLGEEFGEVCRAVLERGLDGGHAHDAHGQNLREEVTQLVAVGVAWLEHLDADRDTPV